MSIHFFTEFWFYHNPWISNLDLVIQIFGIEPSPPVRVIRSNDNGIQEQGWVWQYFMRRPACSGQVYRCPRGSLGVPIWAASDYLEEFVILPIQAIQAIHLCWVWDRDQRVGRQGSAKGSLKIPGSPRGQQRLNWSTGGAWELRYQGFALRMKSFYPSLCDVSTGWVGKTC